jgi:hypothetical protein
VADISAGVAAGLIQTVEPARTIVEQVVRDAEQILRDRCATLLHTGSNET